MSLNDSRLIPALLCAVALVVGLSWALATAPLNGPDEAEHAAYVQHLAETGDGPRRDSGDGPYSDELQAVLVLGNLSAIRGHLEGRPDRATLAALNRRLAGAPKSVRSGGAGPNPVAANPPLYYAYETAAYRLSPTTRPLARLTLLRLATVLLLVATVLLAWLLTGELFTRTWPRVLATGLVALQPKLGFLGGVVNSDALLAAVTTGFLWATARLIRRGPTLGGVMLVALFAAAGPLTHGRGLALVPAGLLAIAVGLWPLRREPLILLRRAAPATALLLLGLAGGYLWTRGHTGEGAFGGGLNRTVESGFSIRQFLSYVWQFYLPRLGFLDPMIGPPYGYRQMYIETFFGSFGSLEVNFPTWVYDALQYAAAFGLAALLATLLLHRDTVRRHAGFGLVALGTFVSFLALLHISAYRALQGGPDPLITGRYLLPLVALYALAVSWVVSALGRRAGPWIAAALLAGTTLLTLSGIGLTAWRFGG